MTRYELMAREQAARFMDELARAVAEERERCAKIAEDFGSWPDGPIIAKLIRGGDE